MAKQVGPVFLTGTVGNITYYKMDGQYYARSKSSLSRKRVKRSRSFKRTMEYADWLAQASKIAAAIYRLFPRKTRQHDDYRTITGQAMQLLKSGVEKEIIQELLEKEYRHKFDPELAGYIDLDQEKENGELHNAVTQSSGTAAILPDMPAQQTAGISVPSPKTSRRLQYYNIRGEKIQRKQGGWAVIPKTYETATVQPNGALVYAEDAAFTLPSGKTDICSLPAPAPA
ncbi:hypothetical protein SAMN04488505_109145 [Chitinophaga rupis]|uniref:Uncharacterized protein n=1 Tax=Chitinophaga rupis TaxID=573321 RepID=A0A1H8F9V6_9BACT|nr:hypothetical protein [Chitinophaga rupis]SEN28532.1 hypothetical protein SAMN04488505_109145 [Chitinophaga rupis]